MKISIVSKIILILCLVCFLQGKVINPFCSACHQIVEFVRKNSPLRPTVEVCNEIGTKYCQIKHLQNNNVCLGAVTQMTPIIINSLWNHFVDPHLVCSQIKFCPKEYKIRNLTQQVKDILASTPNKTWQKPSRRFTLKIMHISDLHPDLFYTVGAKTNCTEPVCCRGNVTRLNMTFEERLRQYEEGNVLLESNNEINANNSAGYWGSLSNCDLPFQTFDLFLKELSKMDLDLIIWT